MIDKVLSIAVTRSPLLYGLLYLITIPVFSFYYTFFIPSEFHHSNILLEQGFQQELSDERLNIENELSDYFTEIWNFILKTETTGKARSFEVTQIRHINGAFYFVLHSDSGNNVSGVMDLRLGIDRGNTVSFSCQAKQYGILDSDAIVASYNARSPEIPFFNPEKTGYQLNCHSFWRVAEEFFMFDSRAEGDEIHEQSDLGFLSGVRKIESVPDAAFVSVREIYLGVELGELNSVVNKPKMIGLLDRYTKLASGSQLDPSWSVFTRMTYFSAVTITTLGFGDIAPISDKARWAVALESILGIIFIGLFLNALARRFSPR